MADRTIDSTLKKDSQPTALDTRYHEIGIPAVAAAVRYTNTPDAKEPAHDPGPSGDPHHVHGKAA